MDTFKQLYPSTRNLVEGEKSSYRKGGDCTDDGSSVKSGLSLFDGDMSLSTLDSNMDDSLSEQSLSSSTNLHDGARSSFKARHRSSFTTDLHDNHHGRGRTNSLNVSIIFCSFSLRSDNRLHSNLNEC